MNKLLFHGVLITAIFSVQFASFAQSLPRPDRDGDYYSDWFQWLVVNRGTLNCRSGPGSIYRVIKRFSRGEKIYVFTQSDEPVMRRDAQGFPWLRALPTGYQYEDPCFVRANSRFVRPIPLDRSRE